MTRLKLSNLDMLARSVRLLSTAGKWEAAAALATELLAGVDLPSVVSGPAHDEMAGLLVDLGRLALRSGRPVADRSPAELCELAGALVDSPEAASAVSQETRNHVRYWAATTRLHETSDSGQAQAATRTLESLLVEYPVSDVRSTIKRALHLSRIARAHERCAELNALSDQALATFERANLIHAEAEALLEQVGWTSSPDQCVLLQRRAITLRAHAWAQFNHSKVWPQDLMRGALATLQRALSLLNELSGLHMRDEFHVRRRLALSLIDCGRFEEALSEARALAPRAEAAAVGDPELHTMKCTLLTIRMAASVHTHWVLKLPMDAALFGRTTWDGGRRFLENSGALARAAYEFDVTVLRLMRSRDLTQLWRHRTTSGVLDARLESVRRIAGPHSPETLFRASVIGVLANPPGNNVLFNGADHES